MINNEAVLSWFTGKAKEKATLALTQLAASIEQGYWIPKASRSVRAALTNYKRHGRGRVD